MQRNRRLLLVCLSFCLTAIATAAGQSAQRPSDKDMKELFDAVDNGRDRFEDQLDGKLKNSIVRGPRGEVDVDEFLDDFQANIDRLKGRFMSNYAASAEAATVLQQATTIHRFIKSQSGELKGGSEWDRLVMDLNRLAHAYGTVFPLPAEGPVRRINDGETAETASLLAEDLDVLKNEAGKSKTLDKPAKESLKKSLSDAKKQADVVKSRASGGKPGTAEARALLESVRGLGPTIGRGGLSPKGSQAWTAAQQHLAKLEQAYNLAP